MLGVNTGYGGSADTRTDELVTLQSALLQHQQSGVLLPIDKGNGITGDGLGYHSMPASWVKGLILVRCNSIIRGHSAVSLPIIETLLKLIQHGFTPIIPLRGSISASGDLQPLAYLAGVIEGNPDIFVRTGQGPSSKTVPATEALNMANLQPLMLRPKEGLGLMNGTAPSATVASLAIHEAHHLAVLSQTLTAMAVEVLQSSAESFHPFIARSRPHAGQIEVASNITRLLQGSKLARDLQNEKDRQVDGLVQARYPTRTAPQWIGPQLEDLLLADRQISTELNSTTDNPLVVRTSGN